MHWVRQGRAIVKTCVIKEVVVGEVIPLSTRIPQVARGAILKALQTVVHQDFPVTGVLPAREFKPPASRAVVSSLGIVLGVPGVGLHPRCVPGVRLHQI